MNIEYKENGIIVDGTEIPLYEIINKCNEAKIEGQDLVILKIEWDGRGYNVTEERTFPKETAETIIELLLGKSIGFGEIAGKHSDVSGEIERVDFEIIEDKEKVQHFLTLHPQGVEYNYSFIDTLIEYFEDNGGRDYWEENESEEWCDDIEELNTIVYGE